MNVFATLILFIIATTVHAQYPKQCVTDTALKSRECCPLGEDGSKCSSNSGRGICRAIVVDKIDNLQESRELLLDERKEWPTVFYDSACECFGNFDGVDCGKCKPGYEGRFCETKSVLNVRRNALELSSAEKLNLVEIFNKSKHVISPTYVILTTSYDRILQGEKPIFQNVTIFNIFAWMHYYAPRANLRFTDEDLVNLTTNGQLPTQQQLSDFLKTSPKLIISDYYNYAHEGPAFLPWHRYFVLKLEQELREFVANDTTFTIPYWNWTNETTKCDVCTNDLMGNSSEDDPTLLDPNSLFSKWEIICTMGNNYIKNGTQCSGKGEGPLRRNPSNYDRTRSSGLPTVTDVEDSLLFQNYDSPPYNRSANFSFRNVLEGFANPKTRFVTKDFSTMHNAVHLYLNGTMSIVAMAANDPIFHMHHSFVDSLYERWLQQNKNYPALVKNLTKGFIRNGHRPYDYLVPFFPLVRVVEGISESQYFGYEYDYLNKPTTATSAGDTVYFNIIVMYLAIALCVIFSPAECLVMIY